MSDEMKFKAVLLLIVVMGLAAIFLSAKPFASKQDLLFTVLYQNKSLQRGVMSFSELKVVDQPEPTLEIINSVRKHAEDSLNAEKTSVVIIGVTKIRK